MDVTPWRGHHVGLDPVAFRGERSAKKKKPSDDFVDNGAGSRICRRSRAGACGCPAGRRAEGSSPPWAQRSPRRWVEASCSATIPCERVGEISAPFRLALGEGLVLANCRSQANGQRRRAAEPKTWVLPSGGGNAAEADAVIGLAARSAAGAEPCQRLLPVSDHDLERGLAGLPDPNWQSEGVIEIARRELGQS